MLPAPDSTEEYIIRGSMMIVQFIELLVCCISLLQVFRAQKSEQTQSNLSTEMESKEPADLTVTQTETQATEVTQQSATESNIKPTPTRIKDRSKREPVTLVMKLLIGLIICFLLQCLLGFIFGIYCLVITATFELFTHWLTQIAQVWYGLGRLGMVLLFIAKLDTLFKDTPLQINRKGMIALIIIDAVGVSITSIQSIVKIFIPFSQNITTMLIIIYFFMDMGVSITVLTLFKKRLVVLTAGFDGSETSKSLINLANKYTYLYALMYLSTVVVYFGTLTFSKTTEPHRYFRAFVINALLQFDGALNCVTAYYSMNFAKSKYEKNCKNCETKCLTYCCCCKECCNCC